MPNLVLDIRTLSVVLSVTTIVPVVFMLYFKFSRQVYKGFGHWSLGGVALALGGLLLPLRGWLPDFVTVVLANTMLVAGASVFHQGTRQFLELPPKPWLNYFLPPLAMVSFAYFLYLAPNVLARIIIMSICQGLIWGSCAWDLTSHSKAEIKTTTRLAAVIFALVALSQLLRLTATILRPGSQDLFQEDAYQSLYFLVVVALAMSIIFSLWLMTFQRLEAQYLRAQDDLRRLALKDHLTSTYNYMHFRQLARRELNLARRHDRPLGLLFLDLDHFKSVNDTWGHEAGDLALKAVAAVLSSRIRRTDILGRVGGEEFALVLPETDLRQSLRLAEDLRRGIASSPVDYDSRQIELTVSIGVTARLAEDGDLETMLRRADQAMYRAKQQGRNRIAHDPSMC
ncbi:MAG: GGDEF domain-containing protein [Pseudomonadota bacterium]